MKGNKLLKSFVEKTKKVIKEFSSRTKPSIKKDRWGNFSVIRICRLCEHKTKRCHQHKHYFQARRGRVCSAKLRKTDIDQTQPAFFTAPSFQAAEWRRELKTLPSSNLVPKESLHCWMSLLNCSLAYCFLLVSSCNSPLTFRITCANF